MDFVFDDGGRSDAGFRGITGDCVCRAISIATKKSYREVYDTLNSEAHRQFTVARGMSKKKAAESSSRTGVHRSVYDNYLRMIGWRWTPTMGIGSGCRVHLCSGELPEGRLIVRLSKHLCAVVDGVIHDISDPSRCGTRCVYGYWESPPIYLLRRGDSPANWEIETMTITHEQFEELRKVEDALRLSRRTLESLQHALGDEPRTVKTEPLYAEIQRLSLLSHPRN